MEELIELVNLKAWANKYSKIRPTYEDFCEKLKVLLEELLSKESIKYHAIEARAKSVESFAEKIQRKPHTDPLQEITDLSGLRVIVYYENDVDKVCSMLDNEFRVDDSRSVDKRAQLATDQFGYLSVHKIISLSDPRAKLPEWSRFKNLVAEVQVRTVLQHAWAAISHTLQYKRERDIPRQLRRRLLRLSGLLELADEQFSTLRRDQEDLRKETIERIEERNLEDIAINALTVGEFVATSDIVKEIVSMARDVGIAIEGEDEVYSQLITVCEMARITGIGALEEQLNSLRPKAKSFFRRLSGGGPALLYSVNSTGGPDHWLAALIVGAHKDKFTKEDIDFYLEWGEGYASDILEASQVLVDA